MLSRVDQTKLPSYQIGMQQGIQQGMQQGMQQGELAVVVRLLTRRLGNIHDDLLDRVKSLTLEKLERLSEDLLEFKTVQDLEKWF